MQAKFGYIECGGKENADFLARSKLTNETIVDLARCPADWQGGTVAPNMERLCDAKQLRMA
ncbi:hypothetical protein FACS189475_06450 [Betaproteobacteria bacterium]|nr:hypothetical protein FACS189475_06450 [Betaproteobacteria bacterium]